MTSNYTAPRIYVACLASYNNGVLHGSWIDCEGKGADELQEAVNAILRTSRFPNVTVEHEGKQVPSAEEWAIHDHEGFGKLIGEHTPLQTVALIAEALAGDHSLAFRWLVEDRGVKPEDAADQAEDVCIFRDESAWSDDALLASYAQEFVEDCYSDALDKLPSLIRGNIDWQGIGKDLQLGGDIDLAEVEGERCIITNASEF